MQLPSESYHNGYKIIKFNEIHSTNDFAWERASNNTPNHKTVILADHQTSGKGQYDRKWVADKGKNITMSVIMAFDEWLLKDGFYLNIIVSVSIIKAVKKNFGINLNIKWPNDIYYGEKKLGGILIKNRIKKSNIEHSIIGIGLNVNQDYFDISIPNPISLKMITYKITSLTNLIKAILDELNYSFEKVSTGKVRELHMQYKDCLFARETFRTYLINKKQKRMAIVDVKENGEIVLKDEIGNLFCLKSGLEYII